MLGTALTGPSHMHTDTLANKHTHTHTLTHRFLHAHLYSTAYIPGLLESPFTNVSARGQIFHQSDKTLTLINTHTAGPQCVMGGVELYLPAGEKDLILSFLLMLDVRLLDLVIPEGLL